jgi:DNA repair protein RadA/Sms
MFVCSHCRHGSSKWFGRCPDCGAWSSARESSSTATPRPVVTTLASAAPKHRLSTGLAALDSVLGGGLVPGAVTLLAGEPGIGKSTLVLQLLDEMAAGGLRAMLAAGEESLDQVGLRAARLGIAADHLLALPSTSVTDVLAAVEAERPDVIVIDSIQTLVHEGVDAAPGSVTQVSECARAMVGYAKSSGTALVLVGHVTKDGAVAGPKALEHVVDVVLTLDGERSGGLRLLRAIKNRFGACDEIGVFEMGGRGLKAVPDPSAMLLESRRAGVPGSVVFAGLEGSRPVLVEIQALVSKSSMAQPRRVAIGIDSRRLIVLTGVLSRRAGLSIHEQDVFVAAAGGLMVREPAADLAACLAVCSALRDVPVNPGLVAVGEVGLSGELRRVPGLERRLVEAARLGFTAAIIPSRTERVPAGIRAIEVEALGDAIDAVAALTNVSA